MSRLDEDDLLAIIAEAKSSMEQYLALELLLYVRSSKPLDVALDSVQCSCGRCYDCVPRNGRF